MDRKVAAKTYTIPLRFHKPNHQECENLARRCAVVCYATLKYFQNHLFLVNHNYQNGNDKKTYDYLDHFPR